MARTLIIFAAFSTVALCQDSVVPTILRTPPVEESRSSDESMQSSVVEFVPAKYLQPNIRLTPPTVQDFHQPELWKMQLGESLHIALKNNPNISVQQYVPQLAQTEVMQGHKRFDPRIEANHHWSMNQRTLANNIDTFGTGSNRQTTGLYGQATGRPDQLAISKTLRSGTSVRAGFSTAYTDVSPVGSFNTLNPAWRSTTHLEFSKPLARGRGERVQTLPISIAQAYKHTTEYDFQSIVLKLLRDVEHGYWNLSFAHMNLEVRRKNVVEARKTYEKELEKLSLGESSRPEVAEAKLHYLHMIDLYHMRKTELLEDERAFRQLIGLPGFDTRRIFVELPDTPPELDVDWDSSVAVMLEIRPDLVSQRYTTKSAEMRYRLACDNCKPDLNFEGRFGKSGLDDRFDESIDRMVNEEDFSWMLGFSYAAHVNRWGAKAETRRAFLAWCQQRAITERDEFSATHSLQRAYEQVYQKKSRVEHLSGLRMAASERLVAYKEKFELGDLAIELYLRAQAADADAELKQRSANVELMQAMVHFEFVRGTLLDARHISIVETEPKMSRAENPEGNLLELPKMTDMPNRARAPEFRDMLKDLSPQVKESLLRDEKP